MAISEVCQFELKEEVDKYKDINPGLSLAECIRKIIAFYQSAGIEIKEETARTKYKRASQVGSNEPPSSTPESSNENQDNQEPKPQHGGQREGAGPPRKYSTPEESAALMNLKRWWKKASPDDHKDFLLWLEYSTRDEE